MQEEKTHFITGQQAYTALEPLHAPPAGTLPSALISAGRPGSAGIGSYLFNNHLVFFKSHPIHLVF